MNLIGCPLPRLEDERFLKGQGHFTGDLTRDGQGYAAFLRSDVASGTTQAIDLERARSLSGVRLVIGAEDAQKHGCGSFPTLGAIDGQFSIPRPVMPTCVRHVGEIIAMVVADDLCTAQDALEHIDYRIDQNEPVTGLDAPNGETAYHWANGDAIAVRRKLENSAWVVDVKAESNRVVVHSMETRTALAEIDPRTGVVTLHSASQGAHKLRDMVAAALHLDRDLLRVVTQDVGGAFGMKLQGYPEQALLVLAAKLTGQAVKWAASRSESSLMDAHGRAQTLSARLGLDQNGRFTALQIDNLADLGAYTTGFGALTPSLSGCKVAGHVYEIPEISLGIQARYTNKVPVDAYRGAGKPELVYILERAIDEAAKVSGIDRIELRRRNLIRAEKLPHPLPLGQKIDTGEFEKILDRVLDLSEWHSFEQRRTNAASQKRLAGIGIGMHMHVSGGFTNERSLIKLMSNGEVIVDTGSQSGGQGHATLFAQIVASKLELPIENIVVRQGDTDLIEDGGGTGGSSSLPIAGVNIASASTVVLDEARKRAADHFEVAAGDLDYHSGLFSVVGTDKRIGLFELTTEREIAVGCDYEGDHTTFPNGAYVAEIEIDPDTGYLALVRFTGVDDIGTVYNPLIAMGQIHGGIVQGLGQAMCEIGHYDQQGQMINATLMDYALPRAVDLCSLDCHFEPVATLTNTLGAKGAGELGPAGALAPVVLAALDALKEHGVNHIDMTFTSEKIWQALQRKH